ncbi:hypothetical protein ACET3Z_002945 [Daucus carota]
MEALLDKSGFRFWRRQKSRDFMREMLVDTHTKVDDHVSSVLLDERELVKNGGEVVRMKVFVKKEDLEKVLQAMRANSGKSSVIASILPSSLYLEECINAMKRRRISRGTPVKSSFYNRSSWRPALSSIPDKLQRILKMKMGALKENSEHKFWRSRKDQNFSSEKIADTDTRVGDDVTSVLIGRGEVVSHQKNIGEMVRTKIFVVKNENLEKVLKFMRGNTKNSGDISSISSSLSLEECIHFMQRRRIWRASLVKSSWHANSAWRPTLHSIPE